MPEDGARGCRAAGLQRFSRSVLAGAADRAQERSVADAHAGAGQSLSGRPHDALVMLQRLVAMGVATDVETTTTSASFARCRPGQTSRPSSKACRHRTSRCRPRRPPPHQRRLRQLPPSRRTPQQQRSATSRLGKARKRTRRSLSHRNLNRRRRHRRQSRPRLPGPGRRAQRDRSARILGTWSDRRRPRL